MKNYTDYDILDLIKKMKLQNEDTLGIGKDFRCKKKSSFGLRIHSFLNYKGLKYLICRDNISYHTQKWMHFRIGDEKNRLYSAWSRSLEHLEDPKTTSLSISIDPEYNRQLLNLIERLLIFDEDKLVLHNGEFFVFDEKKGCLVKYNPKPTSKSEYKYWKDHIKNEDKIQIDMSGELLKKISEKFSFEELENLKMKVIK